MTEILNPRVARQRFQIVMALRLYAFALIALGLVLWRTDWVGVTQPLLGRYTLGVGAIVLVAGPRLLMRRWRRPG